MPMPFGRRKSKDALVGLPSAEAVAAADAEAAAAAAAACEAEKTAARARKEEARLINEAVVRRLSEMDSMRQADDEQSVSPSVKQRPSRTRRKSHDGTLGREVSGDSMAWSEFRESSLGMSKKDLEKAKQGIMHKQELIVQLASKRDSKASGDSLRSEPSSERSPQASPICKPPNDKGSSKGKVSSRDRMAEMQKEAAEKKAALGIAVPADSVEGDKASSNKAAIGTAKAAAKHAGGVFLSFAENAALREKLRELEQRVDELEVDKADLTEKLRERTGNTKTEQPTVQGDATGDERQPVRPPASTPLVGEDTQPAQGGILQAMGNLWGASPFARRSNPSPPAAGFMRNRSGSFKRSIINVDIERKGSHGDAQGSVLGAVGAAIASLSPTSRRVPSADPSAAASKNTLW